MALQARYQVVVTDTSLATEIEAYLNESGKGNSEAFREAIVEKMERDGHFEEDES